MAFQKAGRVGFSVGGDKRTHNFRVNASDDKLFIWVEDTVTKEQWQTNEMALTDFVTLETVIPRATTKDYAHRVVECFGQADATQSETKPTRSLSKPAADGARTLFVAFPLVVGTFETTLEYCFPLAKVPLDPVDLLAARMRDMEERIALLETENGALKNRVTKLEKK